MNIYFAPMEGITGYVFRNAYMKYYGGVDKYYMPFVSPGTGKKLITKERRDMLPENNVGVPAVPQVLTNKAEQFVRVAGLAKDFGYREINLNAGCPSGTVVAKKKGSGLLTDLTLLDEMLDKIFLESPLPVSVKTRIGNENPEEFKEILKVYNQYPISELIIHPRVRKQFYNGVPDYEVYRWAVENSKNPVCYNGDIASATDLEKFSDADAVMIGRGFLRKPDMLLGNEKKDYKTLWKFHQEVWEGYRLQMGDDRNAMFRMKEFWSYLSEYFPDCDKCMKKIRKAKNKDEFEVAVKLIFSAVENCDIM